MHIVHLISFLPLTKDSFRKLNVTILIQIMSKFKRNGSLNPIPPGEIPKRRLVWDLLWTFSPVQLEWNQASGMFNRHTWFWYADSQICISVYEFLIQSFHFRSENIWDPERKKCFSQTPGTLTAGSWQSYDHHRSLLTSSPGFLMRYCTLAGHTPGNSCSTCTFWRHTKCNWPH